jgi:hypothetical protein
MKREPITGYVNIFGTSFSEDEIERLFDKAKELKRTRFDYEEFLDDAIFSFDFTKFTVAVFVEDEEKKIVVAKILKRDAIEVAEFTDNDEVFDAYYAL